MGVALEVELELELDELSSSLLLSSTRFDVLERLRDGTAAAAAKAISLAFLRRCWLA